MAAYALQPELQRRTPITNAGRLIYQAHIDQKKLECLYCVLQCTTCNKESAARRSFLDVYTNGIKTNTPIVVCCCLQVDRTNFMFFDDPRIGSSGKAACCNPAPFPCPHCFDWFGEVYYFYRCFGCCLPNCLPLGLGHAGMCVFQGCCSCCITDLFCGLAPGEAEKVANIVKMARAGDYTLIEYPPMHTSTYAMGEPIAPPQSRNKV